MKPKAVDLHRAILGLDPWRDEAGLRIGLRGRQNNAQEARMQQRIGIEQEIVIRLDRRYPLIVPARKAGVPGRSDQLSRSP